MEEDFEDHVNEELDIISHAFWGSETLDKLEILYRRAYYCATTSRDERFRPELCLSREETEWVLAELDQSDDLRRCGRLIRILKYDCEHWDLTFPSLVRFLEGPSRALALEVLWIFRGTEAVGEYADYFIRLMRGQPWNFDYLSTCQSAAMNCVDEFLHRYSHPKLLRELLNIHESDEYHTDVRGEALCSLGRIVGINYLPDAEVLTRIRDRLAKEEGWGKPSAPM